MSASELKDSMKKSLFFLISPGRLNRKEEGRKLRQQLHKPTGLPWWLSGKEVPAKAGDVGLIRGSGRSPGRGHINMPGASVRNPTRDKVMRKEAWQNTRTWSGFRGSPWNFLSIHPLKKIRICLLFHSSNILWKKSNQGFSLLHLKGMFQLNPLW